MYDVGLQTINIQYVMLFNHYLETEVKYLGTDDQKQNETLCDPRSDE